jgi:hypothetical protein
MSMAGWQRILNHRIPIFFPWLARCQVDALRAAQYAYRAMITIVGDDPQERT